MSVSKDLKLIAKIVDVGDLRPVIDAGITAAKFKDHDARLMFESLHKYYCARKTKGEVMTREMVEDSFTTVDLPEPDRMSLPSVIEGFLVRDVQAELLELNDYISEWVDSEPDKVIHTLEEKIKELGKVRRVTQDIVVSDEANDAVKRYEESQMNTGLKGLPYPWDLLNEETRGMLDGEYIIFYGRPKSLKTWVALNCCTHAYQHANARVLIYTREMSPQQMMDRTICLLIGAPWEAYKKAILHTIPYPDSRMFVNMEEAFYDLASHMRQDENAMELEMGKRRSIIITSDREDRQYGGGVNGLRRKVEDHKPDLIFVDAVYLMRNDREGKKSLKWTDQAAISQDLKDLAQDFKRPLIATLQANRASENDRGGSTANMAYADAFAQDCDLGIEIIKKRINKETNELILAVTASREMNIAGFAINGNPGGNFSHLIRKETDAFGYPTDQHCRVVFNDHSEIKDVLKEVNKRAAEPEHLVDSKSKVMNDVFHKKTSTTPDFGIKGGVKGGTKRVSPRRS